ncbi:hypothetical protein MIND_00653400 [Mycena indigotica]|uniref:Cytochrome P450 n=1 Tax=Mycena indigotica TaxID=2126181 RepID=A0A8H6STR5_9AGAR|nr:uncharacterized protein MIND_00653400 [Mycena indigotica]KAF7304212.1 hypothetical protein MIND_00653400 [Mycena indigotica]
MIVGILLPVAGTLVAYLCAHALLIFYRNRASPLRRILPSPPTQNIVLGNFKQIADDATLTSKWREEYGSTYLFHGLFSVSELFTTDLKALNHIMAHPEIYQRPPTQRDTIRRLIGEGVLFAEAEQHKRHCHLQNPAFGTIQIRAVTQIFVEKALQLRDLWAKEQSGTIEVISGLRKMTLDVIGRAGFGYDFAALDGTGNTELDQAFTGLFHAPNSKLYGALRVAQSMMPILKLFPVPGQRLLNAARERMFVISRQIIEESKAHLLAEDEELDKLNSLDRRRDLLSILLRANMSADLPDHQKLSDNEVVAQIPGFFLAGHETTSSAAAWALHALSTNKAAQTKLREEVLSVDTDHPTLDELNALPYLEQVVRETLRAHSPVTAMQRKAMYDDALPLSKPIVDREGREHWSLPIPRGQMVQLPIWAVNTSKEVWGEDALEFKPERWSAVPAAASEVPGVWANLFTFLSGPHHCIGFRFALVEFKALLFTLVRAFEFDASVPKSGIAPFTAGAIQRPSVLLPGQSQRGQKSGLPLVVTPLNT